MKKFEVALLIQAIDKVSGPAKGITAAIRKMTAAEAEQDKHATRHAAHSREHARKHEGGFFAGIHEGLGRIGEFLPELTGIAFGIEGAVEGYRKLTEASDAAAQAQLKLSTIMMHVRGTTQRDVDGVMAAAEKMEGRSSYKHTIFENAAAGLATFGMNARQIKQMLPAVADYLALSKGIKATNEDGAMAAKLLGKAYAGTTTSLRRQGIVLTAAQEAILKHGTAAQRTAVVIAAIESRAGGLAKKQSLTDEGQVQNFENTWERIKEKAGAALKPIRLGFIHLLSEAMPYVNKFADAIPGAIDKGLRFMKRLGGQIQGVMNHVFGVAFSGGNSTSGFLATFKSLGATLNKAIQPIIPVWTSVKAFIIKAAGQIGQWLVTMWMKAQPGLHKLAEAFKPIMEAVSELWHRVLVPFWDNVLGPLLGWLLTSFVPGLINVLGPVVKWLAASLATAIHYLISFFASLGTGTWKIWEFLTKLWDRLKNAFVSLKGTLTAIWIDIWTGLFKWVEDKWGDFLDIFRKVGQYFGMGDAFTPMSQPAHRAPAPMGGSLVHAFTTPNGAIGGASLQVEVVNRHPGATVKTSVKDPNDWLKSHLGTQLAH